SRRRHTRCLSDWSSDVCSSDLWVVSGRLTQSGYPMMMNDPHRTQSAPSLRYWVHLVAPGWNVIGGGEPVLPGVSIGHNEYGAWRSEERRVGKEGGCVRWRER